MEGSRQHQIMEVVEGKNEINVWFYHPVPSPCFRGEAYGTQWRSVLPLSVKLSSNHQRCILLGVQLVPGIFLPDHRGVSIPAAQDKNVQACRGICQAYQAVQCWAVELTVQQGILSKVQAASQKGWVSERIPLAQGNTASHGRPGLVLS